MDESYGAQTGDVFKDPKIVRWEVDVFINGVKDTTWHFTDPVELDEFKNDEVANNPESSVTFSDPREVEESMPTE